MPQIGNRKFDFGLNTCDNSEIIYILNGKYSHFETWVGLESDGEQPGKKAVDTTSKRNGNGAVIFQIFTDGNKSYDSGVIGSTSLAKLVKLNIARVNELELVVEHVKNAVKVQWADPILTTSTVEQNVEKSTAIYEVKGGNSTRIWLD